MWLINLSVQGDCHLWRSHHLFHDLLRDERTAQIHRPRGACKEGYVRVSEKLGTQDHGQGVSATLAIRP